MKYQCKNFSSYQIIEAMCAFHGISMDQLDTDELIYRLQNAINKCPGLTMEEKYFKALTEGVDDDSFDKEYNELLDKYEHFDEVIDVLADINLYIENY